MLTCTLIPALSRRASRTMCVPPAHSPASHFTVHTSTTSSAYLQPSLKRDAAPVSTQTLSRRCAPFHPPRPQPPRSPRRLVRQHPLTSLTWRSRQRTPRSSRLMRPQPPRSPRRLVRQHPLPSPMWRSRQRTPHSSTLMSP